VGSICARGRGHRLGSGGSSIGLDTNGCRCATPAKIWTAANRFGWLKENGQKVKENLKENRGLSKEEYTKKMSSSPKSRGRDIYPLVVEGSPMKLAIVIITALVAVCIPQAMGQYTAEYWSNQADQYFFNNSFEEAAASYDKALELDPSNVDLWNNKGKALANLGRFEDAIVSFDRALAINSTYVATLNLKGVAFSQGLKRNDEAISSFDQALQLDSSNFDAWIGKGMALANSGDFSGSLACFETATQIEPLNPSGWNNEGVVLREMGRYQEALDSFNKALLLDPTHEGAQLNRRYTLQDMDQNNQASLSQNTEGML
jgi:tetratricopeptide (TPR) repeat protein